MGRKFNILEHELVPKHILLDKKTALSILKELNINISELPWMLASDPAAQAIGAKPGDIVLIVRKSKTAGTSITFRLVVPG